MKRTIISCISFLFVYTGFSQIHKEFHDCDSIRETPVFIKAEVPPKFSDSLQTLQSFFSTLFHNKLIKGNVTGKIVIELYIAKDGKYCCTQLDNNSNIPINLDKLKYFIDSNMKWEVAMQNGHKVPCMKLIVIYFTGNDLHISE